MSTALAAIVLATAPLAAAAPTDFDAYLMPDRAAEIALARTAAPPSVSDAAAVLVMTRGGFVEAAKGTNGFTCVVFRGFSANASDPNFWNPRVRAPHCFNPAAGRTILPEMLRRAEWILGGVAPEAVETRTKAAYASGEFKVPEGGAMAYMLSPRQHLGDENPHWMPHLMLYFDGATPASAWGAGGFTSPVIDASAGHPNEAVLTLLVPVPRWSDGTPAPAGH